MVYNTVSRKISIVLPDDLMKRISAWAKDKNEKSLIFGIRVSTAARTLIEKGLEHDGK